MPLPTPKSPHTLAVDDFTDIKSNLSALTKKGLLLLAQKYKIKVYKKAHKAQMVESFFNRVPSNLLDALFDEIERQRCQKTSSRKKPL